MSLVLKQRLDREECSTYTLQIIVEDGGVPSFSSSSLLVVKVEDANDNSPVFTTDKYQVRIFENTDPGSLVLNVFATDPDLGSNGVVWYSFNDEVHQNVRSTFKLNSLTGDVTLHSNIDYEEQSEYSFVMEAYDFGDVPNTGSAAVVISVIDLNDNPPEIKINYLDSNNNFASLEEVDNSDTTVCLVTVNDYDGTSLNSRFNCFINDSRFYMQAIYSGDTFIVKTNEFFDREVESKITVSYTCTDTGNPPLSTTEYIRIIITDVNDNHPEIKYFYNNINDDYDYSPYEPNKPGVRIAFNKSDRYSFNVSELAPINTSLITIIATDRDEGQNSALKYQIIGDDNLSMEQQTVIIRKSFDREKQDFHEYRIEISDQGEPMQLTSTMYISILIQDEDDNYPIFGSTLYHFTIPENEQSGSHVGVVTASDADVSDGYKNFVYCLVGEPQNENAKYGNFTENVSKRVYNKNDDGHRNDYKLFGVNPKTGEIKTKISFDREVSEFEGLSV
ncbi:hypothetical protein HELRODRAFT_74602 [Helobdella robusta]|uniref:Cadherin domain-containing protein n=1 Tax=Helobdella robusta TaxID=6412 RepID=T1G1T3_HELRO|nr:hypothetical protein HELRODRAFT_74602 [Helobdella robusta]ESO08943.1 hypothetical protein HELRODRAFT_74602 [Helobdella robusta]